MRIPTSKMLKGAYDETTLSKALLDPDDLLTGGTQPPSEAEQEILTYVMRNQNNGERTSSRGDHPQLQPPSIRLVSDGRAHSRRPTVPHGQGRTARHRSARCPKALEMLKNSRQHGSVRVRLQEQFDATQGQRPEKIPPRLLRPSEQRRGRPLRRPDSPPRRLAAEARDLTMLLDQAARYAFLEPLRPIAERLNKLAEKDYTYLLNNLADFEDDLLTAKDDLLSPIKAFMHGPQRNAYDEAIAFLREEEANFVELPSEEAQPLRDLAASAHPYRGGAVPAAKTAVAKLRGLAR